MSLLPGKFKKLAEKMHQRPKRQQDINLIRKSLKENLAPHILPPGDTSLVSWFKECWKSAGKGG